MSQIAWSKNGDAMDGRVNGKVMYYVAPFAKTWSAMAYAFTPQSLSLTMPTAESAMALCDAHLGQMRKAIA
jgi:hypothetical protein